MLEALNYVEAFSAQKEVPHSFLPPSDRIIITTRGHLPFIFAKPTSKCETRYFDNLTINFIVITISMSLAYNV